MRIIYDERRGGTAMAFLVAGLAWGGMLAVSAIAFFQDFLGIPPEHLVVPEASAELWAALWKAAGLGGGISLIFGLLGEGIATRIAVDERGIKKLRRWGGDCFLIEWANVRSWWVESYEKTSYVTVTRLVVELAPTEKPFVVEDARYQTAVVAELSAVVPMRRSRDVSAMDHACMTPPDTLTQHAGFRWVEGSGGYRLDFPIPDWQPRHAVTLWLFLLQNPAFNRSIVSLNIGPEFVTVEDRTGREQKWRRDAIHSVRVDRHFTGDSEPGNSQVFYEVMLCFHDGSSLSVWGRGTGGDFPFFRDETQFSDPNIRAAVAWLSTTLRQVLGLRAANEAVKFNG